MRLMLKVEYVSLMINVLACVPFLFNWWLAVPQAIWACIKVIRLLCAQRLEEQ